ATMEFESFHQGTLLYIGVQEGQSAAVDALLAIVGEKGEDVSALINADGDKKETPKTEEAPQKESKTTAVNNKDQAGSSKVAIPEGVEIVTMPRLSDTMTDGTVATWLKKVGDTIKEGDIIAEIETDKATMEFESFHQGTLLFIGVEEGQSAKVDSVLAIVGNKDANIDALVQAIKSGAFTSEDKKSAEPEIPKPEAEKPKTAPVEQKPMVSQPITNTGGRVVASPLARKMAQEKGINLAGVTGSGEHGRIVKRDIENYVPAQAPVGTQITFAPKGQESFEEVPNSQMRKVIAKRLAESKFTAPHYYLNVEFNMDNAIAFREQFNSLPDTKISFNDIVIKATALALKQHPQVNSQWFDDRIRKNHHVHIGVAVAVEDGLVVPVLRFADEQNLMQIGAAVKDYATRARNKKLTPQEMEGSTFTISNLGMFGITDFTSIINQPNSAILSVGAIVEKPIVKNGKIVVGNTMKLTMACDHRTVDGATGALFLQTLRGFIENPVTMLI
ncbi:MAG: pyruvate dehydrogenase complex dihydrolipoamide acetyltransferase, partial [Flavobacteriaceae bacterium]|nr:pyruvate dehydrogenase complex dihydrolipoamide acetyltransferase [Flavobacteriaceae bacterium]